MRRTRENWEVAEHSRIEKGSHEHFALLSQPVRDYVRQICEYRS